MGETGIRVLSFKLLVLSLILFIMLGSVPSVLDTELFIVKPVSAATTTNTTVYLPGMEKNLTTGEINKYYSVGGVTLQRSQRGGVEKLYYLFPDHLSSTRLVVDKEVKETDYLSYYPYGNLKAISLPSSITNLYTGQKQDREINLYYYHARYYNPTVGHFISADSAQGPNRYIYVLNNPINKTDPTGNITEEELKRIGEEMIDWTMYANNPVMIIIVDQNSNDPKIREIYQFMKDKGFWGMTHEDLPITRDFVCSPNCQFYRKDVLANMTIDYSEKLLVHETIHNRQAYEDPKLAEHVRGPESVNKAYLTLLEGAAEDATGRTTKAYDKYFENFKIIEKWSRDVSEEYMNDAEKGKSYHHEIYKKTGLYDLKKMGSVWYPIVYAEFERARQGDWESFLRLRKVYDTYFEEGAFDKFMTN